MLFLPIYIGPSSAIIRHWGCSTVPGSRLNIGGLLACLQRRIHTCAYKTVVNQATSLKNGSITILPMEISPRSSVSWHTIERAPAVMRFLVAMLSRSDLCAAVLVVSGTRNPTRNCVGLWFPGGGGMTSHIIRVRAFTRPRLVFKINLLSNNEFFRARFILPTRCRS